MNNSTVFKKLLLARLQIYLKHPNIYECNMNIFEPTICNSFSNVAVIRRKHKSRGSVPRHMVVNDTSPTCQSRYISYKVKR